MSTVFHILDAITQDVELGQETEDTQEVIPALTGDLTDDDEEVRPAAKKRRGACGPDGAAAPQTDPSKLLMNIFLFGATATGEPVRACVSGFRPFFFVRLPDDSPRTFEAFKGRLSEVLWSKKKWLRKVVRVKAEKRKVLYGYTADAQFPFARISVPSMTAFRALRRIFLDPETSKPVFELREGDAALQVYEANLDPMLRFFHLRNIKPCGWVQTEEEIVDGQLQVAWEEIAPCEAPPLASAPFLSAFWDIECYSENGEFPLAKKGYDRLAKQLYAATESPAEIIDLVVAAAMTPDQPPKGMDGLRHRDGAGRANEARIREALGAEHVQEMMEPLLTRKEGLSVSSRDDRITRLRGILGNCLKAVLPLAGDPVIQIGVVLTRGTEPAGKHIFVLGDCDEVPGATVYSYKTEKALILGWAEAMAGWNPDVLIGYNVFGFDEKYLWERAVELRITETESMQALSRLRDMNKPMTLEEKFLSSSALGDNTMWIWSAFGRLQVDLFHYIKRSFSLPAYKLDYVCQHFMSGKLSGVEAEEGAATWVVKTKSTGDVIVGRYITLLDETGDAVVEKLRVCEVRSKEALVVEVPEGDDVADIRAALPDAVKWSMVKDDVSPQDIFKLHARGGAAGRARVAAYCIQDCDLTVELYKKLDVFNNAMAMANACSVPVPYIFTRGQGIKIESLIFKECYERGQCIVVLPTQPRRDGTAGADAEEGGGPEESYEGAIVLTPKPGFYFESPVGVADFASLYPSTIISENISHDTLLWVKDYGIDGRFQGYSLGSDEEAAANGSSEAKWTDIDFDIWGTKAGDYRKNPEKERKGLRVCRYAQSKRGTLPDIVAKLLAARKAKRKEAEKETDPFKKALLDAEQLAYKLTANSLYGQLGSATFKVRLQHLAASVTAYGRKQILFAKAAIEQFYGPAAGRRDCCAETVYGDTDSLFINFNVRDPATGERLTGREAIVATQALTTEAGQMVTTCLKPPHDFEYDKVFAPFIIFSKKRYVGNKYEESPDDYYQNSMGIATKRRDYAGIVKVIYGGAIRIMLTEHNPVAAANFVREKLMDLAEGRASMTQLTMTKSLRAEYKSVTPPAHKILADRIAARDPGNAPASGDRISFLYVQPTAGQQAAKSQGERIETPGWIREKGLDIDAKFYMEHQLMNPISQLFALVAEQLPGCEPPKGKSWKDADDAYREFAAGEYLFRDALNACDKKAARRAVQSMFKTVVPMTAEQPKGTAAYTGPATRSRVKAAVAPVPKSVQPNLMQAFAQQLLINQVTKDIKEAKTAKEAKERSSSPETTPPAAAAPAKKGRGGGRKKAAAAGPKVVEI